MPHDQTAFSSRTVVADNSAASALAPVHHSRRVSARVKLGHSLFVQPGHSFSRTEHAERMRGLNASHARLNTHNTTGIHKAISFVKTVNSNQSYRHDTVTLYLIGLGPRL